MKPIREIHSFGYKSSHEGNITETNTPAEIVFEDRAKQQLIIAHDDQDILFPITYYKNEVKHFRFEEGAMFIREKLQELARDFNFNTVPHKYHPELLMGSLDAGNEAYYMQCFGAITESAGKLYLMIYARRGETDFEDNIAYIHGIWQIDSMPQL